MLTRDKKIDITIALKKLHQLQLEGGDLGAEYWLDITQLLIWANEKRNAELSKLVS